MVEASLILAMIAQRYQVQLTLGQHIAADPLHHAAADARRAACTKPRSAVQRHNPARPGPIVMRHLATYNAFTLCALIKSGTVVTASDQYRGDVLIEDEKIALIGTEIDVQSDKVIDATGKYVLPGGIDVHTHLDMPFGGTRSADDFESGTMAAAFGGTTSIVDFAIQYRGQTLHHAWETWMKKAEGKAVVDYGFHMIITDLSDQVESEMDALVGEGVTSFKLFMAYPGVFMLDDGSIFKALLRTGKNGGTICMHAENGGVIDARQRVAEGKRPPTTRHATARAEAEATTRSRWRRSPTCRSTSSICRRPRRSRWSPRRATGDCRRTRKPVRNICFSRTTTTRNRGLPARST
jgi:hypothetical protein